MIFGFGGGIIGIIALICAIWIIVDVLTNQRRMKTGEKVIWIVCAILFNIITAIIYYFVVKN